MRMEIVLVTYDLIIVSGWSNMGGSTESYINLTNILNDNGINTIFVGRHNYHLDKCNGDVLSNINNISSNNMIWHYIQALNINNPMLRDTNVILACHEIDSNRIFEKYKKGIAIRLFNHLQFVSEWQMAWHLKGAGLTKADNMHVIPNLLDPKLYKEHKPPSTKIGGIIGAINRGKQTHISIRKALEDGCDLVKIFGSNNADPDYYSKYIVDMLKHPNVEYCGIVEDKNVMYNSITDVYHYSQYETWGYIQAECKYLNISFHGVLENTIDCVNTSDILDMWSNILKL